MCNIKVIFFDMGNTLLHFHYGKSDDEKDKQGLIYLTEYLKQFSTDITVEDVKVSFLDKWFDGIKDRKETFREYPIEGFLNKFLEKFNVKLNLKQCIEAINLFYTDYREQVYFEGDIYETLKCIKDKGYRIGVISNTCYYDEVMKECFKKAKLHDLIDNFTFSYGLGIGKPSKEIFEKAIEDMNIKPYEAIMVGDNLNSDIKPALEMGMKSIWISGNNKRNNDYIEIAKISDICRYL